MIEIDVLEAKRLEMQSLIENKKSQEERNKTGQFATPTKLAIDILKYAKSFFLEDDKIRFLDPAFGTGSFFSALLRDSLYIKLLRLSVMKLIQYTAKELLNCGERQAYNSILLILLLYFPLI